MKYYSYNDYMDYTWGTNNKKQKIVEEDGENYRHKKYTNIKDKETDEIIKLLKNKHNLNQFLQDFFNFTNLEKMKNIKICNNNIDDENNSLIYKFENNSMYIFIKTINKIDANITYKMFEDSLKIIEKWNECLNKENKKYPIVIPIVIYTGDEEWKSSYNKRAQKINYIEYEKNRINFSYNLIDVNSFEMQQLKKMKSKVAKKLLDKHINKYL